MLKGTVVKGVGGFYDVVTPQGIYQCRARGIFRKEGVSPLVGDRVEITVTHEGDREGSLDEILPRRNELIRPRVANVDQAAVVMAVKSPAPNPDLLDRLLLLAEEQSLRVMICINKLDLDQNDTAAALADLYRDAGYPVYLFSTVTGEGLEALREALLGKITILSGPSGVGKSSLVNALAPGFCLETGGVSRKNQRGRHTTRHAELFQLDTDTYIVDAPGFSALSLEHIPPEDLQKYFPEIRAVTAPCRYVGCSHTHEPDCAVKAEVGKTIRRERYERYAALYAELSERKR